MIKPHLTFLFTRPLLALLRFLEISVVAWSLVIGMYIPVAGQPDIDLSIRPDSLTVGDKFQFINKIEIPAGSEIKPAPLKDKLGEAAVLSGITRFENPGESSAVFACTLAVYKTGEFAVPSFTFALIDSAGNVREITGDSLLINVGSILPADSASVAAADIADIREPYRLPEPVWPYVILPFGILLLGYFSYELFRRFRKTPEIPQKPLIPAWEIAYGKLDKLKENRHYEFGRIKQYYFELSLITREYIENRYEFPAVERTTWELENDGRLSAVGEKLCGRLFELFARADMAKFAKGTPLRNDADSDLNFAYDLIRETIPAITEPDSKSEEPLKVEL